ncbi:MAG: hypothetical protein H6818_05375 [Phycisphaerales bacterium]|nr:hypothetical protein [Phycisphaerales bacterium]MCB9863384.1 hypothetical protein [Phycisphaerales bacterium]
MTRATRIVLIAVATIPANLPARASQFGFVDESNVVVAGDLDAPENSLLTTTYDGPATIMTQFSLNGTLRSVIPQTFASEAHFFVANITRGYGFFFETNTFDDVFDTLNVNTPNGAAFMFVEPGDQFAFLAADDFDDGPGADAVWDNVSLTFNDNRPFTDIGTFEPGIVTVDGFSSASETGLGIFDARGTLVGTGIIDVDTPFNTTLEPGSYYMVVGGEGATFADFVSTTSLFDEHVGADPFAITFNGTQVASGALGGSGPNVLFSFTVTPEPATATLVALALLIRRRRRS